PIRDEVIHGITKALAQQPAAVDGSNAQTAEIETLLAELDIRDSIIATHAADTREYQKRISQAEARADKLAEALKEIRSRSAMNLAMNPNPFELTAMLGDIHQIADAAIDKARGKGCRM